MSDEIQEIGHIPLGQARFNAELDASLGGLSEHRGEAMAYDLGKKYDLPPGTSLMRIADWLQDNGKDSGPEWQEVLTELRSGARGQ